jgi:hypothetical protein
MLWQLSQNYTVKPVDLRSGSVPGEVEVLVVIALQAMTDPERFVIDQYLRRRIRMGHLTCSAKQSNIVFSNPSRRH